MLVSLLVDSTARYRQRPISPNSYMVCRQRPSLSSLLFVPFLPIIQRSLVTAYAVTRIVFLRGEMKTFFSIVALVFLLGALALWRGAAPVSAATTTHSDWFWENPFPQGRDLYKVACPSTTLCKAVGDNGTILSWDGANWTADISGTTAYLIDVACPSTTLCKAVGENGVIRSWNGVIWSADNSGTTSYLNGVACPSTTLCKAVGAVARFARGLAGRIGAPTPPARRVTSMA